MKIAVTDANIFIDLIWLEQIEGLFELGMEVVTPQEVIDELIQEQLDVLQPYIESGRLTLWQLLPEAYEALEQWYVSNRLSFPDKTALYVAKTLKAMVLTGDKVFRKHAIAFNLETHGVLWILEQWVFSQRVTPKEAHGLLKNLMRFNEWLPNHDCEALLEKWAEYP